MALLEIRKLRKKFGGLTALDNIDMSVEAGEIHALIGPNGAGKSTLINVVSGTIAATGGKVIFSGHDVTRYGASHRVKMGLARTFQAGVFLRERTVIENIVLGLNLRTKEGYWGSLAGTRSARAAEADTHFNAHEIIEYTGLAGWEDTIAKELPHGLQRILGVCVALATQPRLLMLDEPMSGMNATEISAMMSLVLKVRESGVTLILVEHNMKAVMGLSDRITVLSYGEKIAEGLPGQIRADTHVIDAYLGSEA
jgi:branched-chain amino acid transport system ATP-binding protein